MNFKEFYLRFGRALGPVGALFVLCVILSAATPYFRTLENLHNVVQQSSTNAIIAVGMTFVILTAGIDLSVGSVLALVSVALATALHADVPLPAAIVVALLVGGGCGLVNGFLVGWCKLPPFIATLGMMSIARGAARWFTGGRPISGFDESFRWLATGKLVGVSFPILFTLALFAAATLILVYSRLGRYVYAIGGNEQAAQLSGVNVKLFKCSVYIISGLTCAMAAILMTARLNSANPNVGIAYELDAIAAAVIGGTSLMGGEGSVLGTLVGALIIGVLRNGLNLLNVSSYLQDIVIGGVIIIAALLDRYLKSQKNQ